MNIKSFDAVVFDLDGTIVDSEKYFFEAYKKAFLFYGFEIGDKALEFRSLDRELATKLCNSITSNTISYSIVRAKRNEILNLLIKETPIQLKKGIKEVLTWLKKRYQLFVISSSNLDRIKDILKGVGLLDLIDEVFSANEVKKGKPYPDIYNYFCKKKNLQPSDIVVVEDSPNGVKSAFDAGTNVIFVKDLTEPTSTIKEQCLACLSDIRLLMNII